MISIDYMVLVPDFEGQKAAGDGFSELRLGSVLNRFLDGPRNADHNANRDRDHKGQSICETSDTSMATTHAPILYIQMPMQCNLSIKMPGPPRGRGVVAAKPFARL